jgi:hypothetical protein
MSEQCKTAGIDAAVSDSPIVRRVMVFSGLLLILLTAGGWYWGDWSFARSILMGGALVNGSLWLLKKDTQRLMQRTGDTEGESNTNFGFEKTRFFLRCYARLAVLGLLLFVLASQVTIDVIGLILGLTTVMLSVVIIGLSTGRCWLPSKA